MQQGGWFGLLAPHVQRDTLNMGTIDLVAVLGGSVDMEGRGGS